MENGKSTCPNCGQKIPDQANYCFHCGQKQDSRILKIRGFISNTISTIFHYDSNVWQTFKYLFVPGKLTKDYISGKRKRYLNPVRLFVFLALLYFIVSGPQTLSTDRGNKTSSMFYAFKTAYGNMVIDNLGLNGRSDFPNDSIQELYYSFLQTGVIDTLRLNDTTDWKLDSLSLELNIWPFQVLSYTHVDYRDVYFLSADSVIQKYEVEGMTDRYILKQVLEITTGLNSYEDYFMSKITWLFFLLIPFQGMFMKLMYWKKTYIEHLIFLLHLHSLAFLVLLIYSFLGFILPAAISYSDNTAFYIIMAMLGLGVYYYLATRRVYKDPHWLNAMKMIPLLITYWIGFLISLLFVLFGSMLLF